MLQAYIKAICFNYELTRGYTQSNRKFSAPGLLSQLVYVSYIIGSQSAPYGAPGLRERNLRALRACVYLLKY